MNSGYFYAPWRSSETSSRFCWCRGGGGVMWLIMCRCLFCDGTWPYTHVNSPWRFLAVMSGSSNLEPRDSGENRQNRRIWRLLCTEPRQLKWRHRQVAVSDQVIDWTRLGLFSQTGNKWCIQVADAVLAHPFPSRHSYLVFSVAKLLFFHDFLYACVHFIITDFLRALNY